MSFFLLPDTHGIPKLLDVWLMRSCDTGVNGLLPR